MPYWQQNLQQNCKNYPTKLYFTLLLQKKWDSEKENLSILKSIKKLDRVSINGLSQCQISNYISLHFLSLVAFQVIWKVLTYFSFISCHANIKTKLKNIHGNLGSYFLHDKEKNSPGMTLQFSCIQYSQVHISDCKPKKYGHFKIPWIHTF